MLIEYNSHDNAADDDRKIACQACLVLEFAEHTKIVVAESRKYIDAERVALCRVQSNVPLRRTVIDNMQNEAQKAIDKIFPSPVLAFQTPSEQFTIKIGD